MIIIKVNVNMPVLFHTTVLSKPGTFYVVGGKGGRGGV